MFTIEHHRRSEPATGEDSYTRAEMAEFNKHLHLFRGTKMHVFLSIMLRSDEQAWSHPSLIDIQRDTRFRVSTILSAISALCRMRIDGRRVMLMVSERLKPGVLGKNHFLLFPNEDEVRRYESREIVLN